MAKDHAQEIDHVRLRWEDPPDPAEKAAKPQWGNQKVRAAIVSMARTFVPRAHYLWGTAGNSPGEWAPYPNGNPGGNKLASCSLLPCTLDDKGNENTPKKAIAVLAGRGGEGIIGNLRNQVGLDDLDLATDDDGNVQVRAGKYLSDNLYTDVAVGADGKSSLNLNLDVTESLTARGSVGTEGDSTLGIYFERDY